MTCLALNSKRRREKWWLSCSRTKLRGTVGNFVSLVEKNYFNDMLFHRVMEGFMAQSGGYKLDADEKEQGGDGAGV